MLGVALSTLLMRPGLLGEHLSTSGLALMWLSTLLLAVGARVAFTRASVVLLLLVALSSCWFALTGGGTGTASVADFGIDLLLFVSPIAAAVTVLGRDRIARAFLTLVIVVVALLSASSVITLALAFVGVRIVLVSFVIKEPVEAFVLFPFTPVAGELNVLGVSVPRFTGVAREPGWMAMLSAVCYFAAPLIGQKGARRVRPWLVGGALTPISTAGFGVFAVVAAVQVLLASRRIRRPEGRWIAILTSVAMVPAAVWIALNAPVLGLGAKSDLNAASLDERNRATTVGLDALAHFSLGNQSTPGASSIDLIGAVATNGWPYLVLVVLAIVVPAAIAADRRVVLPAVLVVVLTLLLAQPTPGSTGVFVLLVALYGLHRSDRPSLHSAGVGSASAEADRELTAIVPNRWRGGFDRL